MTEANPPTSIRYTQSGDIAGIVELRQRLYPDTQPWCPDQLHSHPRVFPDG